MSIQVNAISPPAVVPYNQKTPYLTFLKEELKDPRNTLLTLNPQAVSEEHASKEHLWNIARIATLVGYMILALAGCVVTGIFAPTHLWLVPFGTCVTLSPTLNLYAQADEACSSHRQEKEKYRRINEIFQGLSALSYEELRGKFLEFGIRRRDIQDLKNCPDKLRGLSVGLATLLYQCECTKRYLTEYQTVQNQITTQTAPESRQFLLHRTHYLAQATLASRVASAYFHGLLQRPMCQKSREEIGSMTISPPQNYALERVYVRTPDFFVFQRKNTPAIQESEIELRYVNDPLYKAQDAQELSRLSSRIFAAV